MPTPVQVNDWLSIVDQRGFMFLLAVLGFLWPLITVVLAWYAIKKLANPIRRLADIVEDYERDCKGLRAKRHKEDTKNDAVENTP